MKSFSLGIDIGYSSVKIVMVDKENAIVFNKYQLHKGKIKETTKQLFNELKNKFSNSEITYGAVTGSIGKCYLRIF